MRVIYVVRVRNTGRYLAPRGEQTQSITQAVRYDHEHQARMMSYARPEYTVERVELTDDD